jgi:hypothetical protein
MRSRLVLPALVLLFSLGSAGVAAAAPTQEEACFGEFSSTFAQETPKSGLAVSNMAQQGVVGTFASTKPVCP